MGFEYPLHLLIAHRLTASLVEYLLERSVEARIRILRARLTHYLAEHVDEPRPTPVRYFFISRREFARAQAKAECHRTGTGQCLPILSSTGQRRLIKIQRGFHILRVF